MEHLHALMELAKDLNILYIEDDESLQKETKKILDRIFRSVDLACDGVDGIEKFNSKTYDLIVTDIEMPRLDGLSMCKQVKQIDDNIPIIIVSAYSNTDYLLDAISIGINYYILKPIKMPRLVQTLYNVVKYIIDTKMANEYRDAQVQAEIQRASQALLKSVSEASPNPVVVYGDNNIEFMNGTFKDLFENSELESLINNELSLKDFLNNKMSLDGVLKTADDFIEHLDSFTDLNGTKNKISMRTKKGRKIYLVICSKINIDGKKSGFMYTFNDITIVEYQKVQINQYNEYMSDLTYMKYKVKKDESSNSIIDKTSF